MRARSLLAWIAVGLVGLALAAGVTYAATQLSSQRIGLLAEPPSAGEELAPRGGAATVPQPTRTTRADRSGSDRRDRSEEHEEREERRHGGRDQDD